MQATARFRQHLRVPFYAMHVPILPAGQPVNGPPYAVVPQPEHPMLLGSAFKDALGPECVAPSWTQRADVEIFAAVCTFTLCQLVTLPGGHSQWRAAACPQFGTAGDSQAVYTLARWTCKPSLNEVLRVPSAQEQRADYAWAVHGKARVVWRRKSWRNDVPGPLRTAISRARNTGLRSHLDAVFVPNEDVQPNFAHTRKADAWGGHAVCSLVRAGQPCAPVLVHPVFTTRVLPFETYNQGVATHDMEGILDMYRQFRVVPRGKLSRSKRLGGD